MASQGFRFVSAIAASAFLLPLHAATFKTLLVAKGFTRPVYAVTPPGDTKRLFVVEQSSGNIRVIDFAGGAIF